MFLRQVSKNKKQTKKSKFYCCFKLNLIIFLPRPKFEHIQPAMCSEYLVRTHDREYCSLKYMKDQWNTDLLDMLFFFL